MSHSNMDKFSHWKNADSAKHEKKQQNIIRISNDIALNVEEFHLLLLEKKNV